MFCLGLQIAMFLSTGWKLNDYVCLFLSWALTAFWVIKKNSNSIKNLNGYKMHFTKEIIHAHRQIHINL